MRDMHKVSRRVPSWVWSLFHGCSYGGYCRYVARLTSFCAPLLAQACHLDHLITAQVSFTGQNSYEHYRPFVHRYWHGRSIIHTVDRIVSRIERSKIGGHNLYVQFTKSSLFLHDCDKYILLIHIFCGFNVRKFHLDAKTDNFLT